MDDARRKIDGSEHVAAQAAHGKVDLAFPQSQAAAAMFSHAARDFAPLPRACSVVLTTS